MKRDDEVREAPLCRRCYGRGERAGKPCDACQSTGYEGGREP